MPFTAGLAQASDSTNAPAYARSELAATALAWIVPGLGHLYAGERPRGEKILIVGSLTFVGFSWILIDAVQYGFCFDSDCADGPPRWHAPIQGTLVGVGLAAWLFGIYDAHLAVRRQRRRAKPPPPRDWSVFVQPAHHGQRFALGVSLTW